MAAPDEESIVRCETSVGTITLKLRREWSPNGYDRAVELFERHFYDESHFYRVVPNFLVQFGISYSEDEALHTFASTHISDDPSMHMDFKKGMISYAGNGANSRTSQLFIAYKDSKSLGKQKWETPIGEVIEGMENVDNLYSYGDMPPWGKGPEQGKIHNPSYITENFPKTDKFRTCKVERLRETKTSERGVNVLMKEDGTTDEEEFHKAQQEMEEKERDLKNAAAHEEQPILEELVNVREKLKVPYIRKPLGGGSRRDNDIMLVYIGMGAMVVMIVILFAMKRGKKVASKSN